MSHNGLNLYDAHECMEAILSLPRRCQDMIFAGFVSEHEGKHQGIVAGFLINGFYKYLQLKSPIEQIFAVAADTVIYATGHTFEWASQYQIDTNGKTYYADFLIFNPRTNKNALVECDGHDFHEKTKEQVEYGNNRDYDLKKAGYDVFHFSGSQIWKDPFSCAAKVFSFLELEEKGDSNGSR